MFRQRVVDDDLLTHILNDGELDRNLIIGKIQPASYKLPVSNLFATEEENCTVRTILEVLSIHEQDLSTIYYT